MKIYSILLTTAFMAAGLSVHAQDAATTGKIYFVRSTGYNGSALNFHCFIDSSRVCDLKNKHYSVHEVPPGEHKLIVKIYSKELKSAKNAISVTVEPGKTYYVKILPEKAYSIETNLKMLAVSEATIRPVMEKCKEETQCLKQ